MTTNTENPVTTTETPPTEKNPKKATEEKKSSGKARRFFTNPLYITAATLSLASLAWTTYSVLDLMGIGVMAITVAAALDLVWLGVIYAEHHNVPFMGRRETTRYIGMGMVGAVVLLLIWHGLSLEGEVFTVFGLGSDQPLTWDQARAIAVAGPLLPIGAKIIWMLAIAHARDPRAVAPEDKDLLDASARNITYEKITNEQAAERRKLEREENLRIQAEKDEKERQDRERQAAEEQRKHDERIATLNREAEETKAQSEADLAKAEAEHAASLAKFKAEKMREMEEARLNQEMEIEKVRGEKSLELERIRSDADLIQNKDRTYHDIRISRMEHREQLEALSPFIISQAESHSQRPELEPVEIAPVYPAKSTRSRGVTAKIDDPEPETDLFLRPPRTNITDARERKRRLAIDYWVAKESYPKLTQTEFARTKKMNKVNVSRALRSYPRKSVLEEVERRSEAS
ncbi:hypothetical protein [Rhodococcus qingshengii]|uniref:hypothetical protein n=1 Tax=Rhodococcus qingshengii TaxID=334542 RepID=UPI0035DC06A7